MRTDYDDPPRTPQLVRWEEQRQRLLEGEIVPVEEWVDPPRIRVGVTLRATRDFSARMGAHDEETVVGRGGVVYQRADSGDGWETIEVWQGQVRTFRVPDDHIDWAQYTGTINTRSLESLRRAIHRDMAKPDSRYHSRNLGALAKITAVLENPSLSSNSDEAVA